MQTNFAGQLLPLLAYDRTIMEASLCLHNDMFPTSCNKPTGVVSSLLDLMSSKFIARRCLVHNK